MRIPLRAKFSFFIVTFILVLAAVLSGSLFYQVNQSTSEMRIAQRQAVSDILIRQIEDQGVNLSRTLADSLVNHVYYYQMDVIRDLARSARNQHGIEYLYVHDPSGAIIHDGTETVQSYGVDLDDEYLRTVNEKKEGAVPDNYLR